MHRLQISLPHRQARFLAERARIARVSMAEVVRRLLEQDAASAQTAGGVKGIWEIAGIAEDHGPLIEGVAVSESPERYLVGPATGSRVKRHPSKPKRRP